MRLLLRLCFVLGLGCVGTLLWVQDFVEQPTDSKSRRGPFHLKSGQTLKPVLEELALKGFITRPELVYVWARYKGIGSLRSGPYQFALSDSPADMVRMMNEGRVVTERFTIPEGLNRWQIRDLLAEQQWISKNDFDEICDDQAFLKTQGVNQSNCEGIIFPETYTFARGVAPKTIFQRIIQTYHAAYEAVTAKGTGPLGLSETEFLTLASIVEKETGAAHERPRIACVFYNRLKAKPAWRLQTDPTVIYAATLSDPNFNGNIKRYHLHEMNHPYNTYMRSGLPPGPIASPGLAALQAVAKPDDCADFFFVSKNNGEHIFCPTLSCHNQAVHKWQVQYFRKK
jgi:UPF0755 protein